MSSLLALVLVACLGVALADPPTGTSGMTLNGQDISSRMFQDPFTGRMYSNYQVHRALDAMYGSGGQTNNQMMGGNGMGQAGMGQAGMGQAGINQPYQQQQFSSNGNRG